MNIPILQVSVVDKEGACLSSRTTTKLLLLVESLKSLRLLHGGHALHRKNTELLRESCAMPQIKTEQR